MASSVTPRNPRSCRNVSPKFPIHYTHRFKAMAPSKEGCRSAAGEALPYTGILNHTAALLPGQKQLPVALWFVRATASFELLDRDSPGSGLSYHAILLHSAQSGE